MKFENINLEDKPKAHINPKTCAFEELKAMIKADPELYGKVLETIGFSYSFNQIVNRAIHFDYLFSKGLIPIEYVEGKCQEK